MKFKKKIILLSIIGISIFALLGLSFAYLANDIIGNAKDKINVNTVNYGAITVSYPEEYNSIDIAALDLNAASSGETQSYMMKFTLQNVGDVNSVVNIKWHNITNTFCQYRNADYTCADPTVTENYVGDEVKASLYSCDNLTAYNKTTTAEIKSSCTKISATTDQAFPLTGETTVINTTPITINSGVTKYYVIIADIENIAGNQNYQQGKTANLGIKIDFNIRRLADAIYSEYPFQSDADIDFSKTSEDVSQVTNGLYSNDKNNQGGNIKYFRGAVDNYVTFAGITWRVIRINPSGNVRLITQDTVLPNTAFNPTYDDPKYVGYTYDRTAESLGTAAPIKTALDGWYTSNLSTYASYINQTAEYCNDASGSTSAYGAYLRLYTNKTPTFSCPAPISTYGGIYQLPIGTITADEVAYAGGLWITNNTSYYLNNGTDFWTMSPCNFRSYGSYAFEFGVSSTGYLHINDVYRTTPGFRAVIELNSNTLVTGSGTETDPWIVQ